MNKLIALALVAGLAPFAFGTPLGGNTASTTASVQVQVLAPVGVTTANTTSWGAIVADAFPCTVSISSSGTVLAVSGCDLFGGTNPLYTPSIGTFTVTKDTADTVTVTFGTAVTGIPGAVFTYGGGISNQLTNYGGSQQTVPAAPIYGSLTLNNPGYGQLSGTITVSVSYT
jgi:hypothetical protein